MGLSFWEKKQLEPLVSCGRQGSSYSYVNVGMLHMRHGFVLIFHLFLSPINGLKKQEKSQHQQQPYITYVY